MEAAMGKWRENESRETKSFHTEESREWKKVGVLLMKI